MRRLLATTLWQIVAIIAGSMLTTTLLFLALVSLQNTHTGAPWPWAVGHRIISLVDLLEGIPRHKLTSNRVLHLAQRPDLAVKVRRTVPRCSGRSLDAMVLEMALRSELVHKPALRVAACDSTDLSRNIQVLVPIGGYVMEARTGTQGRHPFRFGTPGFGALLFLFISVLAMSLWAIWRVIHPLRRLSEKVERFARDISPSPIVEEGPLEIRNVARALNLMQERITGLIGERTRMLAAVSHDLRTPLTRMRLQLDAAQPVDLEKLRRNVDLMQTMVSTTLTFLHRVEDREECEWIDLDALLSTLCDEYEESGARIRYEGPGHIRFHGRPNALQRALGNLIDNALHYGHAASVTAELTQRAVRIEVADEGPGIAPERLHDVVEPYVRLDSSRHRGDGVGLGLSIVQDIVRAHGGTLELRNREPRGLVARISLPVDA